MALDDYGYYDENGKFIKFKARKYRRKGSKTYHVEPDMDLIRGAAEPSMLNMDLMHGNMDLIHGNDARADLS